DSVLAFRFQERLSHFLNKQRNPARLYRGICRLISLLSTIHRYWTRCLVSLSRRNRMWTAGEVFRLYFLPRRSRRGLLPSHRQVIPLPDDICARLFSLAPDLRFDRRNIDYG